MRINDEGISGPVLDLPALFIVIVSVSIFMAASIHVYSEDENSASYKALLNECSEFSGSISTSPVFCDENGVLDLNKLMLLNRTEVVNRYDPEVLGFHYSVSFSVMLDRNVSSYHASSSNLSADISTASVEYPLSVYDRAADRTYPCIMSVCIWRDA